MKTPIYSKSDLIPFVVTFVDKFQFGDRIHFSYVILAKFGNLAVKQLRPLYPAYKYNFFINRLQEGEVIPVVL